MKSIKILSAMTVTSLALGMSAFSHAADVSVKKADGILVNAAGLTLYTFDKDPVNSGKSVCNGPCAALWPPAIVAADVKASGDYSVITRDDGAKQLAYKGKPVYTYTPDTKAGDRAGDNFKDIWHVIKD